MKIIQNLYLLQPNTDRSIDAATVGEVLLKSRGFFTDDYWFWICIGALFGFSLLFNLLFIAALTFLNRKLSHLISTQSFHS
jgi:sensor c-di-GMP phosphodiesterase-like protein